MANGNELIAQQRQEMQSYVKFLRHSVATRDKSFSRSLDGNCQPSSPARAIAPHMPPFKRHEPFGAQTSFNTVPC